MKKIITFVGTLFAGSLAIGQVHGADSAKRPVTRKVLASDVKSTTTTPGKTSTQKGDPVTWKAAPVTWKASSVKQKTTTVTQKAATYTIKDSRATQKVSSVKSPGNK